MSVRSEFDTVVVDVNGNALSGVEATVKNAGTSTLSTIYTSKSGGGTKSNPITTDSTGLVQFWAAPGSYDITIADTNIPARVTTRTITFEAVSGETTGISWSQIDSAGQVNSTALAANSVTPGKINGVAALPIIPAVKVYKSVAQTIPGSMTETTVTFDTEAFDTNVMHDNATNNGRLTCKTTGIYLVTGNVNWNNATSMQESKSTVRKNGTDYVYEFYAHGVSWGTGALITGHPVSFILDLVVNDYVELRVACANSNTVNGVFNSPATHFGMAYLGRAS